VDRDPTHVTYVVDTLTDSARAGTVANHAYWVSGLRLRNAAARRGTIDARSLAFGSGEPSAPGVRSSPGALEGGSHGPMPFARRAREWGAARANRLVVAATNLASATVDARRARLSCAPQLDVRSDGPLDLRIVCAPTPAARCARTITVALARVLGRRIVEATVRHGARTLTRRRGLDLRRLILRRPTTGAFSLRVTLRTDGGRDARRVTVLRRYRACRT